MENKEENDSKWLRNGWKIRKSQSWNFIITLDLSLAAAGPRHESNLKSNGLISEKIYFSNIKYR